MSNNIWFDPTSDKWVLSDGEHYLEVPYWARGIIADEFERKISDLKAENAKLRELVRNLYACINHRDCDDCEYADAPCDFEGEMRELGVEV